MKIDEFVGIRIAEQKYSSNIYSSYIFQVFSCD